jgi:hypothetical protein
MVFKIAKRLFMGRGEKVKIVHGPRIRFAPSYRKAFLVGHSHEIDLKNLKKIYRTRP